MNDKAVLIAFFYGCLNVITACSHTPRQSLDEVLASWHGSNPDALVEAWGAPSSTYDMSHGGRTLTYQNQRLTSGYAYTGSHWQYRHYWHYRSRPFAYWPYGYSESVVGTHSCRINFVTDPKQEKIVSSSFVGDARTCQELIPRQNF